MANTAISRAESVTRFNSLNPFLRELLPKKLLFCGSFKVILASVKIWGQKWCSTFSNSAWGIINTAALTRNTTAKFRWLQQFSKISRTKFSKFLQEINWRNKYANDSHKVRFSSIDHGLKTKNDELFCKKWTKEHENFSRSTSIPSSLWKLLNSSISVLRARIHLYVMRCAIWCHLYNLRKSEKLPWRSVTFGNVECFNLQRY